MSLVINFFNINFAVKDQLQSVIMTGLNTLLVDNIKLNRQPTLELKNLCY